MQKKVTIREIARKACVSTATVSFVINDRAGVSEATRARVRAVMEAEGFMANANSRRLTLRRSFNVAMLYPQTASPFTDPFYREAVDGLTKELTAAGYNAMFCPLPENEGQRPSPLIAPGNVDGVILLQGVPQPVREYLDQTKLPVVLLDSQQPLPGYDNVGLDCDALMGTAVQYLAGRGHTRIAFLGQSLVPQYYLRCLSGFQRGLTAFGLTVEAGWIQAAGERETDVESALREMLAARCPPTAVCCTSDMLAIAAMRCAQHMGMQVPDDLAVIGVDGIQLGAYVQPPLTTVYCHKDRMGRIAASLLLRKMQGESVQSVQISQFSVISRGSV